MPEYLEIRMEHGSERHVVYLNLKSIDGSYSLISTIFIGDWSTDALLVMLSYSGDSAPAPKQVSRFCRRCQLPALAWKLCHGIALQMRLCVEQRSGDGIVTQGQRNLSCSVFNVQRPDKVMWNGEKADLNFDPGTRLVHLRSFGSKPVTNK
jgi:hypothetical protein